MSKKKAAPRAAFRPRLEALEDRFLLATAIWDGGSPSDANWTTAANWVNDVLPNAGDDLVFPAGAAQTTNTNTFAAGSRFRSITFTGINYVLSGNQLGITSHITQNVPTSSTGPVNTIQAPLRLGGDVIVSARFANTSLILAGAVDLAVSTMIVDTVGNVTINGAVSGTGDIVKNGMGTLQLGGNNNYTGLTTVNAGIVNAVSNTALGASGAGQGTLVNSGATLQIPSGIVTIPEPLTLNGHGIHGGLPSSAFGALSARSGHATWTGPITLGSDTTLAANGATFFNLNGNIDLGNHTLTINSYFPIFCTVNGVISGTGNLAINQNLADTTVNLTANNTYTGSTTVHRATLQLSGNARLASTQYTLNQAGVLLLDNTATNLLNRIPDDATITLNGGSFSFAGNNTASTASSETIGSLVLARGHSGIQSTAGTAEGTSSTVNVGSLVRNAGATVNFAGANLGTPSNRVLFVSSPATVGSSSIDGTGIWPFATFANAGFATYDATNGLVAFTGYFDGIAGASEGDTVRLSNVSEFVTTNRRINGLFLTNSGTSSNVFIVTGSTLSLASGGLAMTITAGIATPGIHPPVTAGPGTLAFEGEGIVFSNVGIFSDTINVPIAGSGGLTIAGTSALNLNPANFAGSSYTGGTRLNSGGIAIPLNARSPLGAAGNLLEVISGALASSGIGTLMLNYPLVMNNGRLSTNVLTPISISGSTTLTGFNTFEINPALTLQGPVLGTGSLHRVSSLSGGELTIAVTSTYSGGTSVSGGTLSVTGGLTGAAPVHVIGGILGGTGSVGQIIAANVGTVNPGTATTLRGILSATGADFSQGGTLRVDIAGFNPGQFDRLHLNNGTLTVGGASRLILDLAGLTTTGRTTIVSYGNRAGTTPFFNQVEVLNNPNNFGVALQYTATGLDLIVTGTPPSAATTIIDDGDVGFSTIGDWTIASEGFQGDTRQSLPGQGDEAIWSFSVRPGRYRVAATWAAGAGRSLTAPYTVYDGNTPLGTFFANQQQPPNDFTDQGVPWENLGNIFDITSNTLTVRLSDLTNGLVVADAIRIHNNTAFPTVTSLTPTATGFIAQLSAAIDPSQLNLYDSQTGGLGLADVTLVGTNTGLVRGSLLVDSTGTRVTFLATGSVLPVDTYTVTLRSAANGFVDPMGNLLDGNLDGTPGDNFVGTFGVSASSAVIVSVSEFARGPGQPIALPATGTGLPLSLSDGSGITALDGTLRYNPDLMMIHTIVAGDLPAGATLNLDLVTPGVVNFSLRSPTPLNPGPLVFGTLLVDVPSPAPYAAKHLLDLTNLRINNGAIAAVDDDGFHVTAYLGDTTGNATYSSTDALFALRVAVGQDSGFVAYPLVDPRHVADVNNNGVLNSTDATRILQRAVGIPRPEFPELPPNPPAFDPSGPDPLLNIPQRFRARRGQTITVPVNLDISQGLESGDLALAYDTQRLEVVNVQRGRLTQDFDLFAVNLDQEAGTIRVGLGRNEGPINGRGRGSVLFITFRVRSDAAPGKTIINLRESVAGTPTQLNEGNLVLNPAPNDAAGDALDGVITIGPGRPVRPTAELIDAVFAAQGRKRR